MVTSSVAAVKAFGVPARRASRASKRGELRAPRGALLDRERPARERASQRLDILGASLCD